MQKQYEPPEAKLDLSYYISEDYCDVEAQLSCELLPNCSVCLGRTNGELFVSLTSGSGTVSVENFPEEQLVKLVSGINRLLDVLKRDP